MSLFACLHVRQKIAVRVGPTALMLIAPTLTAAVTLLCLSSTTMAHAQVPNSYTVTDLGVLTGNSPFKVSSANAINSKGQIVGNSYKDQYGNTSGPLAVFWDTDLVPQEPLSALFPPPHYDHYFTSLNDVGQILGTLRDEVAGTSIPFVFSASGVTMLSVPEKNGNAKKINKQGQVVGNVDVTGVNGGRASIWNVNGARTDLFTDFAGLAFDINDSGIAVGAYDTSGANDGPHPFIWDSVNGRQDLLPAGQFGQARAINNSGVIGGYFYPNNHIHAAFWKNGVVTDVHPGGVQSTVWNISDNGLMVIEAGNSDQSLYYVSDGVKIISLDLLTPVSSSLFETEAYGVNASGQIVGLSYTVAFDPSNPYKFREEHAVLLTPSNTTLPHPASVAGVLTSTIGPLAYDPTIKQWKKTVAFQNTGGANITGPIYFGLAGLDSRSTSFTGPGASGYFLMGSAAGQPYWKIDPAGGKLAPNSSASFTFTFTPLALRYGTNFTINPIVAGPGKP